MPCRCDGAMEADYAALQKLTHKLTRMLCTLMTTGKPDSEITQWWEEHQREDIERQRREASSPYLRTTRERAQMHLAKGIPFERLSLEEQAALRSPEL